MEVGQCVGRGEEAIKRWLSPSLPNRSWGLDNPPPPEYGTCRTKTNTKRHYHRPTYHMGDQVRSGSRQFDLFSLTRPIVRGMMSGGYRRGLGKGAYTIR